MDSPSLPKRKRSLAIIDMADDDEKPSVYRKGLICTVCGAPATGFNFAVITCMCCKAFFRRNALYGLQSLQCRYLSENCSMNMKTRRDCSYCRLKKCLEVGMKKELILTEELKRAKREKILANREMTMNLIRPINSFNMKKNWQLKDISYSYLTNIYNAYEEYCLLPLTSFERNESELICQQPIKSRFKLQHYFEYYGKHEASLNQFFKRLPELKQFSEDQQAVLCKHNMRYLVRISLIETISSNLPFWPAITQILETIFGKALVEETNILFHNFKQQMNDSTCTRLLIIVSLFSTYYKYNGHIDTLNIYKIQEKYTELLWLYLVDRYGQLVACQKLLIITRLCLHLQRIDHIAEIKRQETIQGPNSFLSLE
jgi:hypothetical protein